VNKRKTSLLEKQGVVRYANVKNFRQEFQSLEVF
jgi:hypothetical protein